MQVILLKRPIRRPLRFGGSRHLVASRSASIVHPNSVSMTAPDERSVVQLAAVN